MTHEQFITELSSVNQALQDSNEVQKLLHKAIYQDKPEKIAKYANTLASCAEMLAIAARKIAENPNA